MDLTVRGMIDEVRTFGNDEAFRGYPDFRIGTVVKTNRPLAWRSRADYIMVQITFAFERLMKWRESLEFSGRIYPGVVVLASSRMARRINASLPDIRIPAQIIDKLDDGKHVGLDIACEQIETIKSSGAFDGVHLVPVGSYKEMATRLKDLR
jgi:methylenetetrahydrofolate reductase (NADPH)